MVKKFNHLLSGGKPPSSGKNSGILSKSGRGQKQDGLSGNQALLGYAKSGARNQTAGEGRKGMSAKAVQDYALNVHNKK